MAEKCALNEHGKLTPCESLAAFSGESSRSSLWRWANRPTPTARERTITMFNRPADKGCRVLVKFCPWCGESIVPPGMEPSNG